MHPITMPVKAIPVTQGCQCVHTRINCSCWSEKLDGLVFLRKLSFFTIFIVIVSVHGNLFIWGEKSSGAVPFGTMFALLVLWFGISVPLAFAGSYLGYKREAIEYPTKTNLIPRAIPEQAWYMQHVFAILVGGVLPFGAVFIELFFILSSIEYPTKTNLIP